MRWLLKRWWIWLAGVLFLFGLCSSAYYLYFGEGRANRAKFELIKPGMTEGQVCAILGEPTTQVICGGDAGLIWCNGDVFPAWSDSIAVWFGDDNRLKAKTFARAKLWKKVERLFLPRESINAKLPQAGIYLAPPQPIH